MVSPTRLASAFAVYTGRNRLARRTAHAATRSRSLAGRRLGAGFLTCTPELAVLAALPHRPRRPRPGPGPRQADARPRRRPRRRTRDQNARRRRRSAGTPSACPFADARHHLHMVGSTGSGKSTLLANMASTTSAPAAASSSSTRKATSSSTSSTGSPPRVADRLVLIDPDQPNPPTLNPLAGDDPDLVVDNIVSIFCKIFARRWGPRIDDVLRVACLTLMRHANATLHHIPPLLNRPSSAPR